MEKSLKSETRPKNSELNAANKDISEEVEIRFELTLNSNPLGSLTFRLHQEKMPVLSYNFLTLCEKGHYTGSTLFKMEPGTYIQGGDIEFGSGVGGYSAFGLKIYEESLEGGFSNPYRLAMTTTGPHSVGSQFFITLTSCPWLKGHFPVFGEVIEGFETLEKLKKLQINEKEMLLDRVEISQVIVLN